MDEGGWQDVCHYQPVYKVPAIEYGDKFIDKRSQNAADSLHACIKARKPRRTRHAAVEMLETMG